PGKPGVSGLGFETTYEVDEAALTALRRIGAHIGLDAERARRRAWFYARPVGEVDGPDQYRFLGRRFVRGARYGLTAEASRGDCDRLLAEIKEARRQADWVIVSLHCHEQGGDSLLTAQTQPDLLEPAAFMRVVAHACIDAGADIIAGHGPHATLGIEIY